MQDDDKRPISIPAEQLRAIASAVAAELIAQPDVADGSLSGTGGGSHHRALPEDVRRGFIDVRAALFQRGIFDPVLVRFDTATVAQAPTREIGERLAAVAETL